MKRVDNRRILYDGQVLKSGTINNKFSSHWPRVMVAGAMQENNKESELPYVNDEGLIPLGELKLKEEP